MSEYESQLSDSGSESQTYARLAYPTQRRLFARRSYATYREYDDAQAQACAEEYANKRFRQMIQMRFNERHHIEILKINNELNEEFYRIVMDSFTEKGTENEVKFESVHTIYKAPEMTFQDIFDYICTEMLSSTTEYNQDDKFEFNLTYHEHEDMLFVTSKEFMKYSLTDLPLSQGDIIIKNKKKREQECGCCEFVSQNISQRCGGCREVYYCDETCQSLDWSRHKNFCYPTTTTTF
jgi:hypothetical protein